MNPLFTPPAEASSMARPVDFLFWTMTGVTGAVAVGIFVLLIVFSVRYRRAHDVNRTLSSGAVGRRRNRRLEATWIAVPLAVFLAFFVWGAVLYFRASVPPRGALEVYVVAKQWMWKLEHPGGRREINTLHVPRGRPVKLVMISQDVIHSFFVPAFRLKHDVLPGRYTVLSFTPVLAGEFRLFCAEYCGTDHSHMGGRIVVLEPDDYARWLSSGEERTSLAAAGAEKFRLLGCSGCHAANAAIHAPRLEGLYGRTVPLSDGRFARVDERYVRDSIMHPSRDIAAGYPDRMPAFAGRISEEDVLELVAYVKSLAGARPTP